MAKKPKVEKFYVEKSGVKCAHCGKPNIIKVRKVILTKAVKAQTTLEAFAEKDTQTSLRSIKKK